MTKAQSPTEIVRAFLAAMAVKDYGAALPYISEACVYTNFPMATVRGPGGVRSILEPFFAPTLENEFIILRQVADGPIVFTERLDRHRLPDHWVELPVTGVWEVRDGLITVWREYFDSATILKVWPAPAG